MKLIKLSDVRKISRNMYMSIWNAQKNGHIKKYYNAQHNVCYDPAEYENWHKNMHTGRRSKLRPITEYTLNELFKLGYVEADKRNQKATKVYSYSSLEGVLDAIKILKNSEVE